MSQVSGLALELKAVISHRAAKPEWMSQVSGLALELKAVISHRAAKPEWRESSFRIELELKGVATSRCFGNFVPSRTIGAPLESKLPLIAIPG